MATGLHFGKLSDSVSAIELREFRAPRRLALLFVERNDMCRRHRGSRPHQRFVCTHGTFGRGRWAPWMTGKCRGHGGAVILSPVAADQYQQLLDDRGKL